MLEEWSRVVGAGYVPVVVSIILLFAMMAIVSYFWKPFLLWRVKAKRLDERARKLRENGNCARRGGTGASKIDGVEFSKSVGDLVCATSDEIINKADIAEVNAVVVTRYLKPRLDRLDGPPHSALLVGVLIGIVFGIANMHFFDGDREGPSSLSTLIEMAEQVIWSSVPFAFVMQGCAMNVMKSWKAKIEDIM